jgi:hypothetical protein
MVRLFQEGFLPRLPARKPRAPLAAWQLRTVPFKATRFRLKRRNPWRLHLRGLDPRKRVPSPLPAELAAKAYP